MNKNIFLHNLRQHVTYENDEQFKRDYENEIPDIPNSLVDVKQEIHRRERVRQNVLQRIENVKRNYVAKHPTVYDFANFDFIDENKVEKVAPNVFALPVFKEDFAITFLDELKNFKASGISHEQPNSMNRHGVLLDEIGFQPFFDQLRSSFIQPMARKLFGMPHLILDSHRAFVVKYAINEDVELAAHFDNAEITLNVALSRDFDEGELIFNDVENTKSLFGYEHKFCHGVLHKGSHIHQALPITTGERWNLVVWTRSSSARKELCPMCRAPPSLMAAPKGTYGDGFLFN